MDAILDRFFETLEHDLQHEFPYYIVKISQVKGRFHVLIKTPRGNRLGDNLKQLLDDVKYISEKVYKNFLDQSIRFRYKFSPYFKLVLQLSVSIFRGKTRLSV